MLFDTVLAFDHVQHRILLIANARITGDEDLEALYQFACAQDRVPRAGARAGAVAAAPGARRRRWPARRTRRRSSSRRRSATAKEHIAAGDIYQVVLSQRFEADVGADPFTVYRALRHVNPSPYMFFVRMGDRVDRRLVARDAGARRGPPRDDAPDRRHAAARHDRRGGPAAGRRAQAQREGAGRARDAGRSRAQRLGRVCDYGTVRVPHLHERSSATRTSCTWCRSSKDSWPRTAIGSTRWWPASRPARCRARRRCARCRSSSELEPGAARPLRRRGRLPRLRRQPRLLHRHPHASCSSSGRAYVQAGAGIVADSNPTAEYEETRDKARAMIRALELAQSRACEAAHGAGHRQLRLVHLQPRAVPRRAGGRRSRSGATTQ